MYYLDHIENFLQVLFLVGILFGCYFLLLFILAIFVAVQADKARKRIKQISSSSFVDEEGGQYMNPYGFNPWNRFFKDLGLGVEPMAWSKIKKKLFRDFPIEDSFDTELTKRVRILKSLFFIHRLLFYGWIIFSLVAIFLVIRYLFL